MSTTLVLGASANTSRYSNMAMRSLLKHGHPIYAVGKTGGEVEGVQIEKTINQGWSVDTVTLYLNPLHQQAYYQQIIQLKPRRVIFNPGTENPEFYDILSKEGIEIVNACTLVMLSVNNY
ncbi:MAG: CoA-binding protein [Bacteroidetes bacterium]|nr:MAG: CoA-binding protein [Bacteroidota bacterium]